MPTCVCTLALLVVTLALPANLPAHTGWWSFSNAPGTGLSLEEQGESIYLVWYLYDSDGRPEWYAALLGQDQADTFSGELTRFTGWPLASGQPGPVATETMGTLVLSFSDDDNGVLQFTDGPTAVEEPISRFLSGQADYPDGNGWWYAASSPGIGWFLEARNGACLMGFCHYGDDGSPRWYLVVGDMPGPGESTVLTLQEYTGGQSLGGEATLPTGVDQGEAFVTVQGSSPDSLSLTIRNTTYELSRYAFGDTPLPFPVVDTGQTEYFADLYPILIEPPGPGEPFYGQDAHFQGLQPAYEDKGDGTVADLNTGLSWQQSPDTNGDGSIDATDKMTYDQALAYADALILGGHSDWRLPTIKELYSLIDFSGIDPSGYEGIDTSGLSPFIDSHVFAFAYGDTGAGERIIDAQFATSSLYVANTANDGGRTMFGVNFADGRIKGYGLNIMGNDKTFFVLCVRGDAGYGQNDFTDNGDGTVSDSATGLMWSQEDSGTALDWEDALAWVEQKNGAQYLGYSDWRLPNAKELQSLVDYQRSPDTTGSAAIDPLFKVTSIANEAGQTDYPCFWSSTTHVNRSKTSGANGVYVAFGRAMGYLNGAWRDVHGAGAQRSDPKTGDPDDYPFGHGPQNDAIRIFNFVRPVRDME